ncbi:hypothetical protein F8M41_008322 [Gigaspora margarita]|uniref:Uncharacterized protein n=1 Tax=Gigaspora margarita TaxID=4874 RepID=A0A8H4AVS8_GIGMA|nr:hypothetical protein F8M41_008322 [Gigaspora margarita]
MTPNTEVSFFKDDNTTEEKATCINFVQDYIPSIVRNTDVIYSNSGNITKNQRALLAQYLTEMNMLATELNVSIIDTTKSDMLFMPQYHDKARFDISFMPQYLNESPPNFGNFVEERMFFLQYTESDHIPFINQKNMDVFPFDHMLASEK